MKLFDVVPGNFFSILTSRNREIYVDALMILHDMFNDELNIRVDEYIASLINMLEDRAFDLEDEDDAVESGNTLSSKARLVLNRLLKSGWIDKEFIDGSFIEIVTPRSYAIPVMKLLGELGDHTMQEYNSLVFSTFSGLRQAKNEDGAHMYEAVLAARANTEQLQYSLRSLYHGIREFLRGIVEQHDVNALLRDHFSEYKALADRVYHPIKTMDSVHRYMGPIQGLLSEVLADAALLRTMRERAMGIKSYDDEARADEEILKSVDFVMHFYQSVGGLVSEIDRKHSNYTKSSVEKIQYLMTADQSTKGNLTEILKAYANADDLGRERVGQILEKFVRTNRQAFFDAQSLYHRSVRSRRGDRQPIPIAMGGGISEAAEKRLREQIVKGYPLARIRAYVETLLAHGVDEIASADIPIVDDTDFVLLILAVIRQNEQGMPHTVHIREGQVECSGYTIPNLVIRRKAVGSRVE